MSALSIARPAVPAAVRVRRGVGSRWLWLAGFYYLIAAVAVTMWLWRDPASRLVAGNPYDSDQFAWFFRYDAAAVAHLRLPALSTAGMNAPQGVNLMWNTPMLLPGMVLAPLTLLAGPQASLTVLMTLGFAGSALAMLAVLRRWGASMPAAAAGGLVYGFCPALIESAQGHYDLQFAVLPPLIIDAILRLATGRCGTGRCWSGRWAAARCGAWLGLLMAAQIFITEEMLFDAGVAAAILLAVLVAGRPRAALSRARAALHRAGDLLAGAATAIAVTAVIAGYPLWEQFLGPVRQHGSPFTPNYYKNDLAGLVQPPGAMLLHTRASAAFAAAFRGQAPEYLAYLGWPMLFVLATAAVLFWQRPAVRATAVTFAVLEVLSLGGTLLAGGHEHAWLALPWYWLQTLPVTGSAIPDRFSILADAAAAALFAFGLDAAWARWAGTAGSFAQSGRGAWWGRGVRWARWAIALVALAAVAPLVPRPLSAGLESGVPSGWTATLTALRLPAGAHVLVLPIPLSTFTEPLRWAADTGVPSSMFGGYFMGPTKTGQAATDGSGLSSAGAYLNQLWAQSPGNGAATGTVTGSAAGTVTGAAKAAVRAAEQARPTRAEMKAQLAEWNPAAVVADTDDHSALGHYLIGLLGQPTVVAGGVLGWRLLPGR